MKSKLLMKPEYPIIIGIVFSTYIIVYVDFTLGIISSAVQNLCMLWCLLMGDRDKEK